MLISNVGDPKNYLSFKKYDVAGTLSNW